MKPKLSSEQENGIRLVRLVKKHPCLYNFQLPQVCTYERRHWRTCCIHYKIIQFQYSQREAVDEAWRSIGAELKVKDIKSLREKWRNYRTVFLRRWKTEKNGTNQNKSTYYLMDEMNFLIDFVKISIPLKGSDQLATPMESSSSPSTSNPTNNQLYTIVQLPADKTDLDLFQEKLDNSNYDDQTTYVPTKQEQQPHYSLSTDNEFMELSPSKNVTTAPTPTDPRKLFFLSIAPEMDKLTDKQFRKFRKLTLDFLDECEDE